MWEGTGMSHRNILLKERTNFMGLHRQPNTALQRQERFVRWHRHSLIKIRYTGCAESRVSTRIRLWHLEVKLGSRLLDTRGIVAFNFSPKNSTQVTNAMKTGQGCIIGFCFSEESTSSQRVLLKIELELNNLNSILSRSAVTPVFPLPLAQVKACRG